MRITQGSVLETLRRAQGFLDANPALLDSIKDVTARRNLDDATAQLAAHSVQQDGSARASTGETANQRTLRLALRVSYMRPIAAIAKEKLHGVPNLHALRMPRGNMTSGPLVAAAGGMAEAAAPHAEVLIEAGLPEDFLDQLRGAAKLLADSIDGRNAHLGTRSRSTKGLSVEERHGRTILKVIDSLIRKKAGSDEKLLAEWNTTKQIRRRPRPAAEEPTPSEVVPGSASASASAPAPSSGGSTPASLPPAA